MLIITLDNGSRCHATLSQMPHKNKSGIPKILPLSTKLATSSRSDSINIHSITLPRINFTADGLITFCINLLSLTDSGAVPAFCQLRELLGQLLDEALPNCWLKTSVFIHLPILNSSLVTTCLLIILPQKYIFCLLFPNCRI